MLRDRCSRGSYGAKIYGGVVGGDALNPIVFALLPLVTLILARLALPSRLMVHAWVGRLVFAGLAVLVLRYLWWRLTVTVLPADDLSLQSIVVWTVFAVEMLAWIDTTILLLMLLRRTDRRAEAAAHEARLRRMDPTDLPSVDVFIATYNEPLSVLEKSMVGAAGLDWPADKLRVWVLDDGQRDWLRDYAEEMGLGYLRRGDNAHAKAGNLNAALERTDGDFVLVLDADFVPQNWFLYRTIGFFDDPKIGIVQAPHHFFNHDPVQSALQLRRTLPDEQRLFFDVIMPGRDGWDCAFCCGSNGVIRRKALAAAGGVLPTSSVTEDILLTMVLLRHGYVTRYLGDRLAVGLAPESLEAYFVQRSRWARGAIQAIFLREGPLGPGMRPIQRLTFLPLHWVSQSLLYTMAMLAPPLFLLTGLPPLMNATTATVLHFQIPAIVGAVMVVQLFAQRSFVPLAQAAHAVLQAFRLLPVIFGTLIRPRGHAFKVTPKGAAARGGRVLDRPTVVITVGTITATALGLTLNLIPATQVIDTDALVPIVMFWAVLNILVLGLVASIAMAPTARRKEERFLIDLPCGVYRDGETARARTLDLSMDGTALEGGPAGLGPGHWVVVDLPGVGRIVGKVMRQIRGPGEVPVHGVQFHLPQGAVRDALIRRLYTQGLDNSAEPKGSLTLAILARLFRREKGRIVPSGPIETPPDWAIAQVAATPIGQTLRDWDRDAAVEAQRPDQVA